MFAVLHTMPDVDTELEALLTRVRQRLYLETLPVLVAYWRKTVFTRGYKPGWWRKFDERLRHLLTAEFPELTAELAANTPPVLLAGQPRPGSSLDPASVRVSLDRERLKPYVERLLNVWLPAEVARLLVNDAESGIPPLAAAAALERLLVRARLSPATLEMLLDPALFSPRNVYPADAEILRDVVLALLGRTSPPAPLIMPAILLFVAPGSALPPDYSDTVGKAVVRAGRSGEELHVPLAPTDCRRILEADQVRIGSIVVTMDGRWWEPSNLLLSYGEGDDAVVYQPRGRLRIDFSADHARLRVPSPDNRTGWGGEVHFPHALELFGREWFASRWEADEERAWFHLVFARPAAVDTAWRPRHAA